MVGFSTLALFCLPLALAGTPPALKTRSSLPDDFSLYAYGTGIGGAPLFYSDGLAYLGDPRKLDNGTFADFVKFNLEDGTLVGNQNVTSDDPSWSNVTFYVPDSDASSHQTGFINSTSTGSDVSTSGFTFFGGVCLHTDGSSMQTLWYAEPLDTEGLWALKWNDTANSSVIVSLKTKAPSRSPFRPRP